MAKDIDVLGYSLRKLMCPNMGARKGGQDGAFAPSRVLTDERFFDIFGLLNRYFYYNFLLYFISPSSDKIPMGAKKMYPNN